MQKLAILNIKGQKVILTAEAPSNMDRGLVVLNYWEQCDFEDIDVLPAVILPYKDIKEKLKIRKENIVIGEVENFV